MKKIIFLFLMSLVLVACGDTNVESDKNSNTTIATTSIGDNETEVVEEDETEEVVDIPTERTIDIMGLPWEYLGKDNIKQYQSEGEVVYLYSDAEAVEQRLVDLAGLDPNAEAFEVYGSKENMIESSMETLSLFVDEVSQYVENEDYFNKLEETFLAMENEEYDLVPSLIDEAKELR